MLHNQPNPFQKGMDNLEIIAHTFPNNKLIKHWLEVLRRTDVKEITDNLDWINYIGITASVNFICDITELNNSIWYWAMTYMYMLKKAQNQDNQSAHSLPTF